MLIKNRETLLAHGNIAGRRIALDILEAGIAATDPYPISRRLVRIEDGRLIVGDPALTQPPGLPLTGSLVFDLRQVRNIYVVGGGKAAQRMAKGIEDALGDRITDGQINTKKGDPVLLKRINVTLAGHPVPDEDSVRGAQRILEIMQRAREGDIVFYCQSGGATALTALPAPGISLDDLREVYRVLYFGGGANMPAANAVRNLIAIINGRHPRYVRGATLIEFGTEENPPDLRVHLFDLPDHTNKYERARYVLERYNCWDKVPQAVRAFILRADPHQGPVTPVELAQRPFYRFRVMGPEYMLQAAENKASELGLEAHTLVSSLSDVAAQPVAEVLAYMAQEIDMLGRPFAPPCVLLCGGEVVVATGDEKGVGGRNQEFVLWAAPRIAGSKNIVIASADADGTDGPTSVAGGIVDGETMQRTSAAGIDLETELCHHNSYPVLQALGDAIATGNTGTNVRDLRVVYIDSRK